MSQRDNLMVPDSFKKEFLTEASLVDFIIFAESEHIGNNHLIGKGFSREETERFEKLAGKLIAATKG